MIRLAFMASGGGSNFQAVLDRIVSGDLASEAVVCICNNSRCGAAEKAAKAGVEFVHLAPSAFESEEEYVYALQGHLERVRADLIILAGYMKRLPSDIISRYRNRVLNIHPALLPAFGGKGMYGHRVHEAVLQYGAKITGVTVHLVDNEYDQGPILMQKAVEVLESDTPETLAARVLVAEHATYWQAIRLFAQGKVRVENRQVFFHE